MPTTHQLAVLLAVADTGSVTAAAARLHVTPPAVSAAVGALAAELGVALVDKAGRGLVLTPAGTTYAAEARAVLARLDHAATAARVAADPEVLPVRLGAVTTAAEDVVPPVLSTWRGRHPRTPVTVEVGNRTRVWEALGAHQVDVVVAGRPPAGPVSLATRPHELALVAAPALGRSPDLGLVTWLLREEGSGTRSTALDLTARLGIEPPTMTIGSNGAVKACAVAGLGVALMSRDAVAGEVRRRELRMLRVDGLPLSRPWHVAARPDGDLPVGARRLLTHLLRHGFNRS